MPGEGILGNKNLPDILVVVNVRVFRGDPAMLQQLQNAPVFVPVIINVQPMTDLRVFLGLKKELLQ